jgi:hypothetical protein
LFDKFPFISHQGGTYMIQCHNVGNPYQLH